MHVLDVDAGLLGDQEVDVCGVKVGTGAEDLGLPQAGDLWATWVAISTGLVMSM